MKRLAVLLSAIVVLGLGINYGVWAQSASPEATPAQTHLEGVGSATVITIHGKIVKVDRAHKLVTLEGPDGRRVTVYVRNPDNLRAAKVGEPFAARLYEVVTIRKKKSGETLQGGSLSEGIWTTNPNGAPGGSRAVLITLPVTVEAIDEANGTVTVKAADGTTETVKPRNKQNLKHLKAGDELVISLYRGIAISLQKESGSGTS
ncbi:MAG: hypothetical protein JO071_13270 [Deltaproteobacteria bacterium]|nr:hypothetical protein [Deltaproteobacteria bacterium]